MSRKKREYDLSVIVAVDETGGYANSHGIPWSFKADWKHFKDVTNGNICVMGRKTYQDIVNRRKKKSPNFSVLLPGRESYMISTTRDEAQGVEFATENIHEIQRKLPDDNREIYILGGSRLWTQYWHTIRQIWMTIVPGEYETTKKFPVDWLTDFEIVEGRKEDTEQGELTFVRYARKVRYYIIQILRPQHRDKLTKHFEETGRLIKNDPYNSKITVVNPSDDEISEIKRVGGLMTIEKGLIK